MTDGAAPADVTRLVKPVNGVGESPAAVPPVMQGERVAFTGTLASMTHEQAAREVEQHGGQAMPHVSGQTTLLVVGEEGWPLDTTGRISQKLATAHLLRAHGQSIRILKETDWLISLDLAGASNRVFSLYSPAQLELLLDVRVGLIRRWERIGLIRPVTRIGRMPLFNFQEVAQVRRFLELLESGISVQDLERSCAVLAALYPAAEHSRVQLELLARDEQLFVKDRHGFYEPVTGQRILDFSCDAMSASTDGAATVKLTAPTLQAVLTPNSTFHPPERAIDCYRQGCEHVERERPDLAIPLFRKSLLLDSRRTETHAALAYALYLVGMREAALERYYVVIEREADDLEAWMRIGDLHRDREELGESIAAYERALAIHPDFADAHFSLGQALRLAGELENAAQHWQRYLDFERLGPWADLARQGLEAFTDRR